jgi:antitoxin component of MazEF toxin-antitoxin module
MRRRTIKKYGNSYAIKLEPTDMDDFGLVEGDIVDIDDLNLLECKKEKQK